MKKLFKMVIVVRWCGRQEDKAALMIVPVCCVFTDGPVVNSDKLTA